MPCVFCDIVNRTVGARIVYEDDAAIAFLDAHPNVEGHTIVMPKRHAEDIYDIAPEDLERVALAAKRVAELLRARLRSDGVNLLHGSGKSGQQSVPHFHVHLLPRWKDDGIDAWPDLGTKRMDLDAVMRKIAG